MAFHILINIPGNKTNWKSLNKNLKRVSNEYFEFFPIPGTAQSKKDHLGASILNKNIPQQQLENLKTTFINLIREGHKIIELYGGSEITIENIDRIFSKYLQPSKQD